MARQTSPSLDVRDVAPAHETRAYLLTLKAGPDGVIEGYGSVFNVTDSYEDVIAPGAFAATLAAHKAAGTMPAMLWQHDVEKPIGVWTDITEDATGLRVRGQLALETSRGKEAYVLCKMNALNGLSIGFVSKQWAYDAQSNIRTLTEIDLWEVSLVTFPANRAARVTGVKSDKQPITSIRQAEQALRDVGVPADKSKELISLVKQVVIAERDASDAATQAAQRAQRLIQSMKEQRHE